MKNNASMFHKQLPKLAFLVALLACAMIPTSMAQSATDSEEVLVFDRKIKMPTATSSEEAGGPQPKYIIEEEVYTGKPETMIKNAANGKMTAAQPKVVVVKKFLMKDLEETLKCAGRGSYCNDILGPTCCTGSHCSTISTATAIVGGLCVVS